MKPKSIRLLLVTKSTSGIAEYVRGLVSGLDRSKFSITVACLSEGNVMFAEELRNRFNVETVGFEMDRYKVNLLSDAILGLRLAKFLRSGGFDLVHAHGSKTGFIVRVASVGTEIPVFYSPHCFAFHAGASPLRKFLIILLERLTAKLTRKYVTVSAGERDLALLYHVGVETQYAVVHTGINKEKFQQPIDKKGMKVSLGIPDSAAVIGSIGRLSAQKRPLDFVRVAAAVLEKKPEVYFVWAGNGPLETRARQLSEESGINSSILWLGQRSDVPQILQILDCFLLTSHWEGFPLVVLEAMAAGVPVVATNISGTREAVQHGQNGFLAPLKDTDGLAECVLNILDDQGRAENFVINGRKRLDSEFTRERMLAMIQNLYLDELSLGGKSNKL